MGLLELAIDVAKHEAFYLADDRIPFRHGAVLFNGKEILSVGHNHYTLPMSMYYMEGLLHGNKHKNVRFKTKRKSIGTMHAEIHCLANLNFKHKLIRGCSMVICGYSAAGNMLMAKPCPNCMEIISIMRIHTVYYSTKSDFSRLVI